MNVLELFSGIGGMHYAIIDSKLPAEVVEAVDINTVANTVYSHNFPQIMLSQNNVQGITAEYINKKNINVILMSPPCQPFTRLGKMMDVEDPRCAALLHIINLIPLLDDKLKYILLENVDGFQNSNARHSLITSLEKSHFCYKEFLLTPAEFGFPNSRLRYYILAKRKPLQFHEDIQIQQLCSHIIENTLELDDSAVDYEAYLLNDKILNKRATLLDIVTKESKHSCCFTRGYTHYIEGTGSVYCPFEETMISETFEKVLRIPENCDEEKLKSLRSLKLRFFTPREVANLLNFPESFSFPQNISIKQKYRLLGNSINVKVVSILLQYLLSGNAT